ncbi:MAG: hypothetical protein KC588_05180 [Nitrospira sp.]|nr:hypothetical protein [Nitrospira sp.]
MDFNKGMKFLFLLILFLQVGCASTLDAWFDRSVQTSTAGSSWRFDAGTSYIGDPGVGEALSMKADRRTVIFVTGGEDKKKIGLFCAEPPPDVAETVISKLDAHLEGKGNVPQLQTDITLKGSIVDDLKKEIIKLADRSEALEVYRTGVYALCQYSVNGHYPADKLQEHFGTLTTTAFTAVQNLADKRKEITANEAKKAEADLKTKQTELEILKIKEGAKEKTKENAEQAAIKATTEAAKALGDAAKKAGDVAVAAGEKATSEVKKDATTGENAAKVVKEISKAVSEAAKAVTDTTKAVNEAVGLESNQ